MTKQVSQPHKRKKIRAYVVGQLKQHVDVGERVEASRARPIWQDEESPIVLVYFRDETADHQQSAPRIYKRTLNLHVDIIFREGMNAIDDFLDSRAFEVEYALLHDRTFGGLVHDCSLTGTAPTEINAEGDSRQGLLRLEFAILYETVDPQGTPTLDEFLKFNTNYENEQGQKLAEDNVVIRTA